MSGTLMIHTPGSQAAVTLEEVQAVPVPAATKSYQPVAHVDLIAEVVGVFEKRLGDAPLTMQLGLARNGHHMFGVATWDQGSDVQGLAVGWRNSYNKTLSVGVVSGSGVFVCDNLCFARELMALRCHTSKVWEDLPRLIAELADKAVPEFNRLEDHRQRMQQVELEDDDAFSLLGIARGRDILPARVYERSVAEWIEPSTPEFKEESNVWGLYQGVTEALKGQPPRDIVRRHNAAHSYFLDAVA